MVPLSIPSLPNVVIQGPLRPLIHSTAGRLVQPCDPVLRAGSNRCGIAEVCHQCIEVHFAAQTIRALGEYGEIIAAIGQKAVDGYPVADIGEDHYIVDLD